MTRVVSEEGLDAILQTLRSQGRKVVGPVVRDGVITHDEIDAVSALPRGWTEEQGPGTYRLEATGTNELFAFSSPSTSWKSYVHPERTLLIRATRTNGVIEVAEPEPAVEPVAFFGIRSCDIAALGVLDRVFLAPGAQDRSYAALRADVFIVAVACGQPGNTCFCASMDTGPTPTAGFDLAVREVFVDRDGSQHHEFLVDAGTERGQAILDAVSSRPAGAADSEAAAAGHDHAVAAMGRTLDPADPPLAAVDLEDPHWSDIAHRCLSCGNCTMICPTCFCSTTEDTTNLVGSESERWRVWDSCFTLDFSAMHGGSVRATTESRYRQWLLHKLVTWHDQFDTSGCVGCGRCIVACPVGIDLTVEIAALATAQRELQGDAQP